MWTKVMLVVAIVVATSVIVNGSQTLLKDLTKHVLKAYDECQEEYNLPDAVATDMMWFWKEGYMVTSRESGCAILCLTTKMNLIDPDGKLHRANMVEFANQRGSDDTTGHTVVDIVHACDASVAPNEDKCIRALDISMCFKMEMHKMDWAPDPELILEEMLAEM